MNLRRISASVILVLFAALHIYAGVYWRHSSWDQLCSVVFAAGYAFAAFALWRRFFWARWAAQGIGVVGTLGCGTALALVMGGALYFGTAETTSIAVQGGLFVTLLALLAGSRMRQAYDLQPSPRNRWRHEHAKTRVLRWALILNVAALPMLFKFAGLAGHTRLLTGVVALALAIAIPLIVLQRTAGLLLLGLAGGATVAVAIQAVGALQQLMAVDGHGLCGFAWGRVQLELAETAMAASAMIPGALSALAALAVFTGPMVRLLRSAR